MSKEEFPKEEELNKEKSSTKKAKPSAKINEKRDHHKVDTVEKLKNDLALSNKKSAEFEDKFLRDEAEIQNMQSRFTKERTQLIKYEAQGLAKDVLPAMDNLERALATEADDEVSKQLKKGVQMTLESLTKAMKDHGIIEIEAEDTKFDPTLHQAVQTVSAENDDQKDKVVKVLQKGYQYKDRTLRPAMVVVAQ